MKNITLNKSFFTLGKNGIADDSYSNKFIEFAASLPEAKGAVEVGFSKLNPLRNTSIKRNMFDRYSYGTLLTWLQGVGDTVFGAIEAVALIQLLVEKQQNGEDGNLLLKENNFLFMKKDDGHIERISMHWCGKGWVINMLSVSMNGDCGGWQGDNCFIRVR
jgi:hypothetical protein